MNFDLTSSIRINNLEIEISRLNSTKRKINVILQNMRKQQNFRSNKNGLLYEKQYTLRNLYKSSHQMVKQYRSEILELNKKEMKLI